MLARNVENTHYYSALVITVDMMLMVTQDRKVYKDQDIEENSTLAICNTSFLLHTYCIVIELWLLQIYMDSTMFVEPVIQWQVIGTGNMIFLINNKALD